VYAQDNELSWIDWEDAREHTVLIDFVERLTALRHKHPVFRRRRFFAGRPLRGSDGLADIAWLRPTGEEMTDEDWDSGFAKSVAVFLNGDAIRESDARGEPVHDDSFLLLLNAHHEPLEFTLPEKGLGNSWSIEVDTALPVSADERHAKAGEKVPVDARSMVVLRRSF
jgi:glycogen operon protein